MAGNGAAFGVGGSLADHDLGGDELLAALAGAGARHAQCPTRPQARDKLAFERTSTPCT